VFVIEKRSRSQRDKKLGPFFFVCVCELIGRVIWVSKKKKVGYRLCWVQSLPWRGFRLRWIWGRGGSRLRCGHSHPRTHAAHIRVSFGDLEWVACLGFAYNFWPYMLVPPRPVPVGSPPWIIKSCFPKKKKKGVRGAGARSSELYMCVKRKCSRIWFDERWRRCSIPFSRVVQSFCMSVGVVWLRYFGLTWWIAEKKCGVDVLLGHGSSRVRPGRFPSLFRVWRILTWEEGHVYVGWVYLKVFTTSL